MKRISKRPTYDPIDDLIDDACLSAATSRSSPTQTFAANPREVGAEDVAAHVEVSDSDPADEVGDDEQPQRPAKRSKKISKVDPEYDPTPIQHELEPGQRRPATVCWVPPEIAKPIGIEAISPLWRDDLKAMGTAERKQRFLASKVVSVGGQFYINDKSTGDWRVRSHGEIRSVIMNDWGREQTSLGIRTATIDEFFKVSAFPVLDQTAYIPGGGAFVDLKGRKALNTWSELPMPYSEGAMDSDEFQVLMEMICSNLIGYEPGRLGDHLPEIMGVDPTPLKWLVHWCASNYQRPGKSLPTALWLVGRQQGVGKGTFTSGLRMLVGHRNAAVVNTEELRGDWSDFIAGKALFIADEIDFGSRRAVADKFKRLIGNDELALRQRNRGVIEVPSVANWVFTTNNTSPILLDPEDRRHTFFETRGGSESQNRARAFHALGDSGKRRAWEGFAELLHMIEIDDALISHALMTDIKLEMIGSNLDPVEAWLDSEEGLKIWPVGTFASTEWLFDQFRRAADDGDMMPGQRTRNHFLRKLTELSSAGLISKKLRHRIPCGQRPWGFVRFKPGEFETVPPEGELQPVASLRGSEKLMKFREETTRAARNTHLKSVQ